jgi:PAS domain S-box-containing protein
MNNNLAIISQDRKLFKHFTIRYGIALTFIALLSIASQVRIQLHLSRSMDDSHVINFAARLRTYSQIVTKSALLLENGYDYESSRKEFVNTLKQWEKAQEGLESGSKFLNLPKDNMEEIKEMFALISHPRQEIIKAAEHIATILDTTKNFRPELIRPDVKTILDYEQSYLLGMDLIVFDYDNFSKERINQLKQIDYLVLGIILVTLVLEAGFIFYPLAIHIKKVVIGLVSSEAEAKRLSDKLQEANESKEKSYNELREINFALDKATYLVKTDPEGKIIYANDKYCHVTKYTMSELRNKPVFYNNMGGQESVIYDHIRDVQKNHEVWQDEIFDYAKDGTGFWLDVTLIPVFDNSGSLYQYLVIGNDITNRKNTEQENKKLTEEKLVRHGIEQKIKSYAIINGQEKERKRIAAEIHDGIGMMLTSVRMKLEQIEDRTDTTDPEIVVVNGMLANLIAETRRICSDLLPSVLEDFGLRSAVEDLVKTCQDSDKKLEFLLDENIQQTPLSRELKISVYRILQEGLNNVIKHSEASKVEIYIDTSGDYLNLMVKDNGKGFHFDIRQLHLKNLAKKMNGIRGMKERTELLSGTFNIITEPGHGTIIQLEIPLAHEREH